MAAVQDQSTIPIDKAIQALLEDRPILCDRSRMVDLFSQHPAKVDRSQQRHARRRTMTIIMMTTAIDRNQVMRSRLLR